MNQEQKNQAQRITELIRAGFASADHERQRRDLVEMEQVLGIGIVVQSQDDSASTRSAREKP